MALADGFLANFCLLVVALLMITSTLLCWSGLSILAGKRIPYRRFRQSRLAVQSALTQKNW